MRVYRCTAIAGKEAEFRAYAAGKSHPWLRQQQGLVAFYAARPLPGSGERDRCMVQIWESEAALRNSMGDDWRQPPKLSDEARAFVEAQSVEHYQLADEFHGATSIPSPKM